MRVEYPIKMKNDIRQPGIHRRSVCLALSVLIASVLAGCSAFNTTRFAGVLGTEENLIHVAYSIAENLERQAFPPLLPRHPQQPILTTTFVNNNNLAETSQFSRVLQEHLTSRFVQLGYTVREIKLRNELQIEPLNGEKILSRNLSQIQQKQTAQAISVGTYSVADRAIYLSARMIDPTNSNIISSVDYKLIMDNNMMAMFGLRPRSQETMDGIVEPRVSLMTRLLYW